MPYDLAVLGQDPRFGGGALALTEAFLSAANALGRQPTLLHDPHPGLGTPRLTWRRAEALRQLSAARRLTAAAREARSLWVVASVAQHGGAAPRSGRPYACWLATTIGSEWSGRRGGLSRLRRAAAGASIRPLQSIEGQVLRHASAIYATSPASRLDIAALTGVSEHQVEVLLIPVDGRRFAPEADSVWFSRLESPVIAFVGRADDPRKNIGLLLRAFSLVRRELPTARLRLIGTRPAEATGEGVEAVGVVPDVVPLLRECAVFALPSLQEGFGIVVAEALACGVPVVVTPSGGPEEIAHASGGGRVISSWSERELADVLLELLGDLPLLGELRSRGRAYVVEKHAPERFRARLARAFRELDG